MTKLTVDHLSYSRRGKNILQDISFTLEKGERLAVLGPNGAGKTTLFSLLTDVIRPDRGNVCFQEGQTFAQIKNRVGVVWDNIRLFPFLKVKEVIRFVSAMYGQPSVPPGYYNCLELGKIENSLMQTLSRGESKRVLIYLAMLSSPQLLLLDEPTAELDPFIREKIWKTIFLTDHRTLVFSTHHWEEAAAYATRIAFLYEGRLINAPCSAAELFAKTALTQKVMVARTTPVDNLPAACWYDEEEYRVYLLTEETAGMLDVIGQTTSAYSVLPPTLKDVYHYLIYTRL